MQDIKQRKIMNEKRRRKRRVRRLKRMMIGVGMVILVLLIHIIVSLCSLVIKTLEYKSEEAVEGEIIYEMSDVRNYDDLSQEDELDIRRVDVMNKLEAFAKQNDFLVNDYPEEIIELLIKNPETEDFVLNYPLNKDKYDNQPLEEALNQNEVPLLLQWDSRWGYYKYGDNVMGLTGCGPTCLSMVAIHLLQDSSMTPIYMANFAQRNGFYAEGIGTAWSFMTQGASELGLQAQEVGLSETTVMNYLQQGYPIICVMGRGDFTETGHFIVMVGVEDGKIKVNDPNSKERSEKLWVFEDIKYQIKNMWVYSSL